MASSIQKMLGLKEGSKINFDYFSIMENNDPDKIVEIIKETLDQTKNILFKNNYDYNQDILLLEVKKNPRDKGCLIELKYLVCSNGEQKCASFHTNDCAIGTIGNSLVIIENTNDKGLICVFSQ